MGLLVGHRNIDLHVYTDELLPTESFARLATCPGIRRMVYGNLSDTVEECLEWRAWYEDEAGEKWAIDMIRISRGSRYDGYFERMADRVCEVTTDEMRETILRLKFETPATEKIMGWSIPRGNQRRWAQLCRTGVLAARESGIGRGGVDALIADS